MTAATHTRTGSDTPLAAARSRDSWGIGDFRDLARLARSAAAGGAGTLPAGPVHGPAARWLDVLHIAPGEAPGADRADLSALAAEARALNDAGEVDRDAVARLKIEALERIWAVVRHEQPAEFRQWADEQGDELTLFATWSVLAGIHGGDWRRWAQRYTHPRSSAVATFTREHADRVRFHMWCQWVADRQLAAARHDGVTIHLDLPADSGPADTWLHQ
ncbi:4-alpha-glucanotransferase [Actinoplanes couchii]|uniref:4-alpha-glucanotransferase n=1 Tax=Actinoplanes couchii TaxID=403638 RepID=A0ABQ3WZR3_9ACTN|nr:4-alpha-glucanotransferase [Actinoplanes couchii]MDR6316155.1 4-alpha-glucanotransferase [Actinoplanes couchii]GID51770.1 hypothetical protein Aco03nite_001740 [Actinoplanes couchii]